jgi:hypothetical protein
MCLLQQPLFYKLVTDLSGVTLTYSRSLCQLSHRLGLGFFVGGKSEKPLYHGRGDGFGPLYK